MREIQRLTRWSPFPTDLDSMTAALTWSYHLSHLELMKNNATASNSSEHPHPTKAIALLQTPRDALDLRPENKLALHNVQMSPGHRDLLTIDELPLPATELAKLIKGIILVDHPVPLTVWNEAKVLSIFDHHKDRGIAKDAKPRIFEATASCTTIVAREMLNELEELPEEYHMPHEVVELILDAIALDSNGLEKATPEDRFTSRRLLKRSNWRNQKLLSVMERLSDEMSKAKKDLESLGVRDLLRRDWKGEWHTGRGSSALSAAVFKPLSSAFLDATGDMAKTKSKEYPSLHLGLASIPYSLDEQIQRTLHETTQSWFDIEQAWTEEIGADISLSLNSYKIRTDSQGRVSKEVDDGDEDDDGDDDEQEDMVDNSDALAMLRKKIKVREICLVVRASDRLSEEAANSIFETIKKAISESPFLDAEPWHKADELKERQ